MYLLLPRPRNYPRVAGGVCAGAALLSVGWFLLRANVVSAEVLLFNAFAAIAIAGGGMMLSHTNPVHAALSFALVVLSSCGLFLLQAAPFLMAATIIVYAGAIVVTFLFVIMLAQQAGNSNADHRTREPLLASIAGFVLLGAILYLLTVHFDTSSLDAWLSRLRDAAEQPTASDMVAIVAPDEDGADNLLDQLGERADGTGGIPASAGIEGTNPARRLQGPLGGSCATTAISKGCARRWSSWTSAFPWKCATPSAA